jgi:hypothetical protein
VRAALVILLATAGSAAAAPVDEPAAIIVVVIDPQAATVVPSGALCAAIAEDVRAPVTTEAATTAPIRGVLTIASDGARLVLSYRNARGEEIRRVVARSDERATRLETIALIAGNLIRDEADELLQQLERPPATHTHADAQPLTTEPTTAIIVEPPPIAGPPTLTRKMPARGSQHPWSIGLLSFISSRSAERVYTTGSGIYVSRALGRHVALGLTDILVFQNGGQYVISAGPFGEAFWFAKDWLQLFGQLGVPMQGRWGGSRDAGFGAQPFAGGGLRFWLKGRVSLGVAARVAVVATNAFGTPPTELIQGTVTGSGGLEVGFRF